MLKSPALAARRAAVGGWSTRRRARSRTGKSDAAGQRSSFSCSSASAVGPGSSPSPGAATALHGSSLRFRV